MAIFFVRVLGQIEVVLLAPAWLPPFRAWESGLIPYPLLLPVQILLIAWMSVIAVDQWRGSGWFWVSRATSRRRLRIAAAFYAAVMLVRLVVTMALPPHSLLDRGLIPILAHWDLAAFLLLVSAAPTASPRRARVMSQVEVTSAPQAGRDWIEGFFSSED